MSAPVCLASLLSALLLSLPASSTGRAAFQHHLPPHSLPARVFDRPPVEPFGRISCCRGPHGRCGMRCVRSAGRSANKGISIRSTGSRSASKGIILKTASQRRQISIHRELIAKCPEGVKIDTCLSYCHYSMNDTSLVSGQGVLLLCACACACAGEVKAALPPTEALRAAPHSRAPGWPPGLRAPSAAEGEQDRAHQRLRDLDGLA